MTSQQIYIASFADTCILYPTAINTKCVSLTLVAVDYESLVTNFKGRWVTEQEIEEARCAKTKIQPITMSELQIDVQIIRNQYISHQRQARVTFDREKYQYVKVLRPL